MNSSYRFLLRKRFGYRWKNLREKMKSYMDFSLLYIVGLMGLFAAFYWEMWTQPHGILQGIAALLTGVPQGRLVPIALILMLQFAHRGLRTPPMIFQKGDTYFLFTLPIPKEQYIFTEWMLVLGKYLFILLGVFLLSGPVLHLMGEGWLAQSGWMFFQGMLFIILLSCIQWLAFQLPKKVKYFIQKGVRWIRNISFIIIGILGVSLIYLFIFQRERLIHVQALSASPAGISAGMNLPIDTILFILCPVFIALSLYFIKRTPLEPLKEISLDQDKIKTLRQIGMVKEAQAMMKGKGKKEKRYFLSIPGFYRKTGIFFWRNASQWIKQPISYLFPYLIYIFLSIGFIRSSQGDALSLVFIFFALYILGGQLMLTPFKKHYEETHFLQIFPMKSKYILRGYLVLPVILTIISGVIIVLYTGWTSGKWGGLMILAANLPFFTYYTLVAAMENVLEDTSWKFSPNGTLHNEAMLLLRGAGPIIFSILFANQGLPVTYLGLGGMVVYLIVSWTAEKDVVNTLKQVLGKFC